MNNDVSSNQSIIRYENGQLFETEDFYVTEFPLTIMVNGEEFATIICSPTNMEELVLGFRFRGSHSKERRIKINSN